MKILTIGNSFAENATVYLEEIVSSVSEDLILGKANLGGCSIQKHANLVKQCDMLPLVKPYNFYQSGQEREMMNLREILSSLDWDFVTLQQVSDLSFREETFFPYLEDLYNLVKSYLPKAEVVIHQTWAYRIDALEYEKYGITQREMNEGLKEVYGKAAKKLGLRVIPCGEAFSRAREIFNYGPDKNCEIDRLVPLELPDQTGSLIKGYYWSTGNTPSGNAELNLDGRHGNDKGCYLANALWYEFFFNKSIYDTDFAPDTIEEGDLKILRGVVRDLRGEY